MHFWRLHAGILKSSKLPPFYKMKQFRQITADWSNVFEERMRLWSQLVQWCTLSLCYLVLRHHRNPNINDRDHLVEPLTTDFLFKQNIQRIFWDKCLSSHHSQELVKVDSSTLVLVDLLHNALNLAPGWSFATTNTTTTAKCMAIKDKKDRNIKKIKKVKHHLERSGSSSVRISLRSSVVMYPLQFWMFFKRIHFINFIIL